MLFLAFCCVAVFFIGFMCRAQTEGVLDEGGFRQEAVPGRDAVRGVRQGGVRGGRSSGNASFGFIRDVCSIKVRHFSPVGGVVFQRVLRLLSSLCAVGGLKGVRLSEIKHVAGTKGNPGEPRFH